MGTIRRKLHAVWKRWPQIVLACGILALTFWMGMGFQSRIDREEQKRDFYSACYATASPIHQLDVWLDFPYFQSLESPMEDPGIEYEMAQMRQAAARIRETMFISGSRSWIDSEVTVAYLEALTDTLLGDGGLEFQPESRLFAVSEPLMNAVEASASFDELLTALETELNTPAGQEALEFLELSEYPLTPDPGEV